MKDWGCRMKKSSKIISALLMAILSASCSVPPQQQVDHNEVPDIPPIEKPVDLPEQPEEPFIPEEPEVPEILFHKTDSIDDFDKANLHEITDKAVISHIEEMFPDSPSYLDKTEKSDEDIFKAIIPIEIDPSIEKEIVDLMIGSIKDAEVVKKYVNRFNSDFYRISDQALYFTRVRNYYILAAEIAINLLFTELNLELDKMSGDIQKIKEFQEQEFTSRIMAAYSSIKEILRFTSEIVEDKDERDRYLINLESIKKEVREQVEQVNLRIQRIVKDEASDFEDYVEKINEETVYIEQQKILLNMLEDISNLVYVFSNGSKSKEFSFATYNEYIDKSNRVRDDLKAWHQNHFVEFGVDLENKKVDKDGIAGIISYIPGVFKKDWRKRELDELFVNTVMEQTKEIAFIAEQPRSLSQENVVLVIMGGKYYYMHP